LPSKSSPVIILTMSVEYRKKTEKPLSFVECAPELWAIFGRLENGRETDQSKRVRRILELLSSLGDNSRGMDAVKVTSELHHLLGHYRWVTHVWISPTTGGYRAIFRQEPGGKNLSREDEWEYAAVADLLDITRYPGALSRLRQCGNPECRRWLFTPKGKTRQSCNGVCKQRRFDSDPEQKKKKRKYMRDYYADGQKRQLNPKCGIGLRRRRP
jgi:hypothetical protein